MTLLELLVGLALTLIIAAALLPAWLGLQSSAVAGGDRAVSLVQSRVAVARLERDLRLAGAGGGRGGGGGLVEADGVHLVLLTSGADGTGCEVVEWEFVGTALMRRRAPEAAAPELPVTHAVFRDHKTMLEGVVAGAAFAYLSGGRLLAEPLAAEDLLDVEEVRIEASLVGPTGKVTEALHLTMEASVGR
jgi:hypothetical protein